MTSIALQIAGYYNVKGGLLFFFFFLRKKEKIKKGWQIDAIKNFLKPPVFFLREQKKISGILYI